MRELNRDVQTWVTSVTYRHALYCHDVQTCVTARTYRLALLPWGTDLRYLRYVQTCVILPWRSDLSYFRYVHTCVILPWRTDCQLAALLPQPSLLSRHLPLIFWRQGRYETARVVTAGRGNIINMKQHPLRQARDRAPPPLGPDTQDWVTSDGRSRQGITAISLNIFLMNFH